MQDITIIGGGYIGAWSAYFAASIFPNWNISIIDKSGMGSGASRYGADLDFTNNTSDEIHQFSTRSRKHFQELVTKIPGLPYHALKAIVIGRQDNFTLNRCQFHHSISHTLRNKFGIGNSHFKIDSDQNVAGPIKSYRGSSKSFISQLLEYSQSLNPNLTINENTPILNVEFLKNSKVNLIHLSDRQIHSKYVISAVGPWSLLVPWSKQFNQNGRIKKIVSYNLNVPSSSSDHIIYLLDEGAFFMPMPETNNWLMSITSKEWDCSPDQVLLDNENDKITAQEILQKYAPELFSFIGPGRVFCDTYSTLGYPSHNISTSGTSHLLAGGCGGSGFRLAPAIAEDTIDELIKLNNIRV